MNKRRSDRTYFNTEYMPQLDEDAFARLDPMEDERRCHGHIDDVVRADRERFYQICKKHGFDCSQLKKESRSKHPDF